MALKREIKDAYIEKGAPIYVKTHSNAVYVDDNETETLTQRLDNVKDSITKHTSQLNAIVPNTTLWFLENIDTIEQGSIIVVQGFYDIEENLVGKYKIDSIKGNEIWNVINVGDNSFKISEDGDIAQDKNLTTADKKLKLLSDNGKIYAGLFGMSSSEGFDNSKLIQFAINKGNEVILPEGNFYIAASLKYNHSNLKLIGNNTTIHGDVYCLLTSSYYEETDLDVSLKNIYIKGITFKRDTLDFNEIDKILFIRHCDGFEIDKCNFIGWNGDAIGIDLLYKLNGDGSNTSDPSTYAKIVPKNIKIHDCLFDGVNNDNSQGIFVCQGTNIEIRNNKFINITRKGMPGAIDLEPWQYIENMHLIEDVDILDNYFENINGTGGVINIHFRAKGFTGKITYPIKNIRIKGNKITKCKSEFFSIRHLHSIVNEVYWESENIEVVGNTFTGDGVEANWKIFGCHGINGITIKDNIFNQVKGVGYLGNCRGTTMQDVDDKNINLVFENNIFNDFAPYYGKEYPGYQPLVELGENDGFLCNNNKFIANTTKFSNCVDGFIFRFIPSTAGVTVKNYIFKNNFIINDQDSNRIKYFLVDNTNNNMTNPVFSGNIMSSNITEHLTSSPS